MYLVPLLLYAIQLNNGEQLLLPLLPEHTARYFAQKLLQNASYRVNAKIVHIDQVSGLQEVNEFLHVTLMARRTENIFPERGFLVQFQYKDLQPRETIASLNCSFNVCVCVCVCRPSAMTYKTLNVLTNKGPGMSFLHTSSSGTPNLTLRQEKQIHARY